MGNSRPEQQAREEIDRLLNAGGWAVQEQYVWPVNNCRCAEAYIARHLTTTMLDKPTSPRRLTLATTQLADDFEYAPEELHRSVQTPEQIRTIARTLRSRWLHCPPVYRTQS